MYAGNVDMKNKKIYPVQDWLRNLIIVPTYLVNV